MNKGWIGVDLDGTLAHYDHWAGPTHIGPPISVMVERVKKWLVDGYEVRIFTARISDPVYRHMIRTAIQDWTEEYIGRKLEVTNIKDYNMLELWEDRAVQVIPNTGEPVGQSTRGLD